MDPLTVIGLVANVLQFVAIVKCLLLLIYQLHRTKPSNKEKVFEAADPALPIPTKWPVVPEGHELVLRQKYSQTVLYPINESLVFFVDAVGRGHSIPLYQCATIEVLDFIPIITPVINIDQDTRPSSSLSFVTSETTPARS